MKIGLIFDYLRLDEKLLLRAAKENNVKVCTINARNIVLNISKFDKLKDVEECDVYLVRCVGTLTGLYVTRIFEEQGLFVINSYNTSLNCIDKINCTLLLAKNNIPVPKTFVAFDEDSSIKAFERMGFPSILKPVIGSWSRLVAKINDIDAARSIVEDRKYMGSWYKIFYIQEFVNKPDRDIRVTVIGDNALCAVYRINENHWCTNTARGGRVEICEMDEKLRELSLKAAEAVGGGILGVDAMEVKNKDYGYVIHEINHSPEFKNIQRVTKIDVAGEIIKYLREVIKK